MGGSGRRMMRREKDDGGWQIWDCYEIFKYKIVKLGDCQIMRLSNYEIFKLWDCQIMRFSNYEIFKLWDFQIMRLSNYEIVKLWDCQIMRLSPIRWVAFLEASNPANHASVSETKLFNFIVRWNYLSTSSAQFEYCTLGSPNIQKCPLYDAWEIQWIWTGIGT